MSNVAVDSKDVTRGKAVDDNGSRPSDTVTQEKAVGDVAVDSKDVTRAKGNGHHGHDTGESGG